MAGRWFANRNLWREGGRSPLSQEPSGPNGFAATDALVALTILSSTVILALGAAHVAARAGGSATEVRQADVLLRRFMDGPPRAPSTQQGADAAFEWRVATTPLAPGPAPSVLLCYRAVEICSRASGKLYRLSTDEMCPAPAGP